MLAAGGFDGTIRVYAIDGGRLRHTLRAHIGPVEGLTFLDDGKRLASAGADGLGRFWTLPENAGDAVPEPLVLRGHAGPINALAASPDGRVVATGGDDKVVRVWNASDGTIAESFDVAAPSPVRSLAYSPKGGSQHRRWARTTGRPASSTRRAVGSSIACRA